VASVLSSDGLLPRGVIPICSMACQLQLNTKFVLHFAMRHRPTDCQLQAAGEGVKQLDNKLVVWRTSNMDRRYVKNAGAVFNLSYHIVFCPKYHRKVLVGDVESRLKHRRKVCV
jgi:hypothetical protein